MRSPTTSSSSTPRSVLCAWASELRPRFISSRHEPVELHEAFSRLNALATYEREFATFPDPPSLLVRTRRVATHPDLDLPPHVRDVVDHALLQLTAAVLTLLTVTYDDAPTTVVTVRCVRDEVASAVPAWLTRFHRRDDRIIYDVADFLLELATVWVTKPRGLCENARALGAAILETARFVDARETRVEMMWRPPRCDTYRYPPTVPAVFRDVLFLVSMLSQECIHLPWFLRNLYHTQPATVSSVVRVHVAMLAVIHALPRDLPESSFQRKFRASFDGGTLHQALVFCLDGWNSVWRRQRWPTHAHARRQLNALARARFGMTRAEAIELLWLVGGLSSSSLH